MLVIRLKPAGRVKRTSYRIVVDEKRSKLNGRVVDDLGYYDPSMNPATLSINREKVTEWVSKGAQPSAAVTKLLNQS